MFQHGTRSSIYCTYMLYMINTQGGVTPIGTVSTAATGVKIFDRRILALTA